MRELSTEECIHIYEYGQLKSKSFVPEAVNAAYVAGLAALYEKLEREKNDPLTLEELREMDGEPVWVETSDIKKANRWAFVDVGCEVVRFFDTRCGVKCQVMGNHFRTYRKTWLAYRRKPEGRTR